MRAEFSLHPQGVTRDLIGSLEAKPNSMATMAMSKVLKTNQIKQMTKLVMPESSTVIKM